ncbi:hypothetical protein [Streptomyces sp. NPDC007988]|uniref:hypothetical protein n=1 Tax=Streptomyces sp. NPDC007988 TaxID=3364802 RepID=UPI0036E1E7B1
MSSRLNAALAGASADSKPEWEREIRHRSIAALDQFDTFTLPADTPDPAGNPLLEGFENRIEWVLRRLKPQQLAVAIAYATGSTWAQAARRTGVPDPEAAQAGEKVRRRLKYLSAEYNRRQQ